MRKTAPTLDLSTSKKKSSSLLKRWRKNPRSIHLQRGGRSRLSLKSFVLSPILRLKDNMALSFRKLLGISSYQQMKKSRIPRSTKLTVRELKKCRRSLQRNLLLRGKRANSKLSFHPSTKQNQTMSNPSFLRTALTSTARSPTSPEVRLAPELTYSPPSPSTTRRKE